MAEWLSSMCGSCCDCCAQCCSSLYKCCCCDCLRKSQKEQYPHILYRQVGSEEDIGDLHPRLERTYSYKYAPADTEFETHPQVVDSSGSNQPQSGRSAITSQPKFTEKRHKRPISSIPEETTSEVSGSQSLSSRDPSMYDSQEELDTGSHIGYIRSSIPVNFGDEPKSPSRLPLVSQRHLSSPLLSIQQGQEHKLHPEYKAKDWKGGHKRQSSAPNFSRARAATLATPEISQTVQRALAHSRSLGEIHTSVNFSLYYDERHSTLIVHLYQLSRLQTRRSEENCNPFLEVYLLPRKSIVYESHVKKHTLNPKYDQVFKFPKLSSAEFCKLILIIRVYNNDKSNFMGGALYPLQEANLYGDRIEARVFQVDEEEFLQEDIEGELLITMCYEPEKNVLELMILEATNLQYKRDILGPPNPYAKVYLLHHKTRHTKWKTSIQKKTHLPVFNESCLFDISDMNIEDLSMEIVLLDYDRFSRNDVTGVVELGSSVVSGSAQEYWRKVFASPKKKHSFWLPLTVAHLQTQRSGSATLQLCVGTQPSHN